MAKGVSRDAHNIESHNRQWNAGLRDRYYPPFLVAQLSVVRIEGRDVFRQGKKHHVWRNQSGVPKLSVYSTLSKFHNKLYLIRSTFCLWKNI